MMVEEEICKSFNAHAHEYERAAKIQEEIGRRLFERLDYLKIKPERVLDLGCGTGLFTQQLRARYPEAKIIGFDLAFNMLKQAKAKQGWFKKWPLVNGDMQAMPFATGAFDLVFANQVVHWGRSLSDVFRELNRVMAANGCLMFTTLGPDTFKELTQAWAQVDDHAHSNEFADMHDLGDALMAEYFLEPVVDMEVIQLQYATLPALLQSLKAQGVKNTHPSRKSGLMGKGYWQQFEQHYATLSTASGKYPLSYEVVYGHAWKGQQGHGVKGREAYVSIQSISKRK